MGNVCAIGDAAADVGIPSKRTRPASRENSSGNFSHSQRSSTPPEDGEDAVGGSLGTFPHAVALRYRRLQKLATAEAAASRQLQKQRGPTPPTPPQQFAASARLPSDEFSTAGMGPRRRSSPAAALAQLLGSTTSAGISNSTAVGGSDDTMTAPTAPAVSVDQVVVRI